MDPTRGSEFWVPRDREFPIGAEMREIIPGRVDLEYVGAIDFGMELPDGVEEPWVLGGVVPRHVRAIFGGEGNHPRVVEHTKEFRAVGANEAAAYLGFVRAHGFADEEDGFRHRLACASLGLCLRSQ